MFNLIIGIFLDSVGGRLLLRDGTLLPARCAICNRPVHCSPRRLRVASGALSAITIYLHLCRWHASRRLLVLILSAAVAIPCGIIVLGRKEGVKPSTSDWFTFAGLIVGGLFLINSIFFNPYFRGVSFDGRAMEIKGFGKRFRESLREDEMRIIQESQFKALRRKPT